MSAQTLLEQLLKSGLSMVQGGSSGQLPGMPRPGQPSVPPSHRSQQGSWPGSASSPQSSGQPAPGGKKDGFAWGTFAGGAGAGSALTLLLGNRRARGMAGKALKAGSVAALGALAYKAYTAYQEQQQRQAQGAAQPPGQPHPAPYGQPPAGGFATAPAPALGYADRVGGAELELHSRAMLVAMIAAAKSDGHLDDRERGLVEAELQRLEADAGVRGWVEGELRRPLEPAEVARAAAGRPELAAEMYLASLLVTDDTNTMERLYLQELARELKLPEGLKLQLEAQARDAIG